METSVKQCNTYWVKIFMAGDINLAKNVCHEFSLTGLCVNVSETEYIYTMGREIGFCVELINYPRFPKDGIALVNKASELGEILLEKCFQGSYTLMTPENTYWVTRKEGDK